MTAEQRAEVANPTPGPWYQSPRDYPSEGLIAIELGDDSPGPYGLIIATAWPVFALDGDEQQRANARLIAASPDLLGALEALVAHPKVQRAATVRDFHRALDAIAKARGQS